MGSDESSVWEHFQDLQHLLCSHTFAALKLVSAICSSTTPRCPRVISGISMNVVKEVNTGPIFPPQPSMELGALTISIQVIKPIQKGDTKHHMLRGRQAKSGKLCGPG